MVNGQRVVPERIDAPAQKHIDALAEIPQLPGRPAHHPPECSLRQRCLCTEQAAQRQTPVPAVIVPVREEILEPRREHGVQTLRVFFRSRKGATLLQQAAHHLCIEKGPLTAGREGLQRSVPLRVLCKLCLQARFIIRPDVGPVRGCVGRDLQFPGTGRISRHGRGGAGHDQDAQPSGQAVGIGRQRARQCIFLRAAALVQTVHHQYHRLVAAIHREPQRLFQQPREQLLFRKALQLRLVFRQMHQKALPVLRQAAGQQIGQCLDHRAGCIVHLHVTAAEQAGRHPGIVMGIVHRKGTLAHARPAVQQTHPFACRVIHPMLQIFLQPCAPHEPLLQQGVLAAGVIIDVQMVMDVLDLPVELPGLLAVQHTEQFLHLPAEPFCKHIRPRCLLLLPVRHVQPLLVPDGGWRLHLLLRRQKDTVDVAALDTHCNGQFIQADPPFPGRMRRQAGHHGIAAAHSFLDGNAPVVAGSDVALVEPWVIAVLLQRCTDALADLTFGVAITQEQPHRLSGLPAHRFLRCFKPVHAFSTDAHAAFDKDLRAPALRAADRFFHPHHRSFRLLSVLHGTVSLLLRVMRGKQRFQRIERTVMVQIFLDAVVKRQHQLIVIALVVLVKAGHGLSIGTV